MTRETARSAALTLLGTRVGSRNAANRRAWLEITLSALPSGSSILDAGAGEQQYRGFCGHLRYTAQDFAAYDGHGSGVGLQTGSWDNGGLDLISDITAIPAPDNSFDTVMCTEVLEHVPDPLAALDELARLVCSGGRLIITAPMCSLTHFAPFHFSTGFNRYFYEEHLPSRGFEIIELVPNGSWFEYLAQELRRLPEVVDKYSSGALRMREYLGLAVVLRALRRFSHSDRGSDELVSFGYHIVALKCGRYPTGT